MPVWGWFFVVAAGVLIVIAVIVGVQAAIARRRTRRLQRSFGPEYLRTVHDAGGRRQAEHELAARERKRQMLDIVPLSREAGENYADRWRGVQYAFVDRPSSALGDAERLLREVMHERGYPIDDFDQRAADISVDHPHVVENYRAAHRIHLSGRHREIDTEEQRQAFVHYRALFDELLDGDTGQDKSRKRAQDHSG